MIMVQTDFNIKYYSLVNHSDFHVKFICASTARGGSIKRRELEGKSSVCF